MNNPLLNKLNKDLKFVYSDNDTLSIIFNNNEILMGVVGEFNNNLKELEKITETKIYSRGNSILVKSSSTKNELIKNAIIFLTDQLILNGSIEKKDIVSSINKFMINEKTDKKIEYIMMHVDADLSLTLRKCSGRKDNWGKRIDGWLVTVGIARIE